MSDQREASRSSGHSGPVVVIMAGGSGTRFWPLSTAERPKQFLRLLGDRSLLQQSYDRALSLTSPERVLVLTGARLVPLVREQLPEIAADQVVGEPQRRDTAAAACLAALIVRSRFAEDGDSVIVTLTSDHRIEPVEDFARVMTSAAEAAAEERVVYTIGIPAAYPSTAYGYLEKGQPVEGTAGARHYRLARFREKPDRETATAFVASGDFLWNSGMFVWTAESILERFSEHLPGHLEALSPVVGARGTIDEEALARAFEALVPVSVDYGIMEKLADSRIAEATFSWSDIGGWQALSVFLPEDAAGNRSRGRVAAESARGNVVFCDDPEELVALVGVEGLTVVRAGRRTLVVPVERAEDVKHLVAGLEEEDR